MDFGEIIFKFVNFEQEPGKDRILVERVLSLDVETSLEAARLSIN